METQSTNITETLNAKEWAIIIFISSLPLIGLIMLLIWAFGEGTNIHKKNWAKGSLILILIMIIISFSFLFLFGGISLLGQFND